MGGEELVKTTRVPMRLCPQCGALLSAATSMKSATPKPGDPTVCINCAALLYFTKDMSLVKANADYLLELHPESRRQLLEAQEAVLKMVRKARGELCQTD